MKTVLDERNGCTHFSESAVVNEQLEKDRNCEHWHVEYACGCVWCSEDDNTPGFRDHWQAFHCKQCKLRAKERAK